jgi:hypothetical protein
MITLPWVCTGLERQQQDREFQLLQNRYGQAIAEQNLTLSSKRWEEAQLRRKMWQRQADFSRDLLQFLGNKMLSAAP